MTQIHIKIMKPKTGGLDPVTGTLRFRPVRRHFDAAKNLIIAASFDADLSEDGELTVDLLPTTPAFVWQVVELADTPQAYTRYVEVPNSQTKVEYADLVEVDAGTFVPKDMTGSQLLKVRHASTQSEAEALSARYPDVLVFFNETASVTQSDLNILASNANTLAASVANDSQTVADTANAVAAKGESAIATIDSTVQAVKDKAEAATTVLPSTGTTEGTTDTGTTEETTEEPGKDSTPAKAKKVTVKEA